MEETILVILIEKSSHTAPESSKVIFCDRIKLGGMHKNWAKYGKLTKMGKKILFWRCSKTKIVTTGHTDRS